MLSVPTTRIRKAMIVIADGEFFGTTLRLPHNPARLTEANSAGYADHRIFGRSRPISQYTGGGVRRWNFELPIECISGAIFQPGIGFKALPDVRNRLFSGDVQVGHQRVLTIVTFLRALIEPRKFQGTPSTNFSEGAPVGPHFFQLIWGDHFVLRLRMRNVEVDWNVFNHRLDPASAFVKCEMSEHPDESPTFETAMRTGYRTQAPFR
jgi:hypothetical protein